MKIFIFPPESQAVKCQIFFTAGKIYRRHLEMTENFPLATAIKTHALHDILEFIAIVSKVDDWRVNNIKNEPAAA
jgi:hypothetical protein